MSPTVPAVGSPRASMTRISPGLTCSTARFWAFIPPPRIGEQVLAERHVAQRPGESGHLRGRPGGVQPVQGDGVVAALAQLGGERRGAHLAHGREQLGGGVGGTGRAPGAVRQLPLRVVRVRHRAGRAEGISGFFDGTAQPAGRLGAVADLDLDEVAGPHHGGARRGAGEDDVAGLERSQPGNIRHDVGERKKQVVAGDGVLHQVTVDPGAQPDVLRVDVAGVQQCRAQRREPVDALGPDVGAPVGVPQVVHAEVVRRRDPPDMVPCLGGGDAGRLFADDQGDLALEGEQLAPRRPPHRVAVGGEGVRRLEEVRRPRRQVPALHRPAAVARVHGDDLGRTLACQRVLCHRQDRIWPGHSATEGGSPASL